jgi:hypothetical protein
MTRLIEASGRSSPIHGRPGAVGRTSDSPIREVPNRRVRERAAVERRDGIRLVPGRFDGLVRARYFRRAGCTRRAVVLRTVRAGSVAGDRRCADVLGAVRKFIANVGFVMPEVIILGSWGRIHSRGCWFVNRTREALQRLAFAYYQWPDAGVSNSIILIDPCHRPRPCRPSQEPARLHRPELVRTSYARFVARSPLSTSESSSQGHSPTRAGQAACAYSCRIPPSRSCLRTSRWTIAACSVIRPVQQFMSAGAYPALHDGVHPRRPDPGDRHGDARVGEGFVEKNGELRVAIADQVPDRGACIVKIHDQIARWLGDPRGGGMRRVACSMTAGTYRLCPLSVTV